MGQLTRATIVSEGLLLAGDTSLTARANVWLNMALRSVYRSWPWPFLHKRHNGVALAAGASSLTFGNGSTETLEVTRIFDPIVVYRAAYDGAGQARVRQLLDQTLETHEAVTNPTINIGIPTEFRVKPSNTVFGTWTLTPNPIPDKAYLLSIDCLIQPADLSLDATVPLYPSDATMIQMVVVAAVKYMMASDPAVLQRYSVEDAALREMVISDRLRYGAIPGVNDQWGLDTSVHK